MMERRQLFGLIFMQLILTTTFIISYQRSNFDSSLTDLVKNLHSKLTDLWRREVYETSNPPTIAELVEDCMRAANFHSPALIEPATANAEYFYREFRKAIPETSLAGYRSHCWVGNYSIQWDKRICQGELGNITFSGDYTRVYPYGLIFSNMTKNYPKRKYRSSLVCLPNIFVAGFPKCGSTFIYHLVTRLISISTGDWNQNEICKEMQFWVHYNFILKDEIRVPKVGDLGAHFLNYIPGIEKISERGPNSTILVDGTPIYIDRWPVFTQEENNMTNYCLIPAALPRLLPDSKYFMMMRNPISKLYSYFWFSCTRLYESKKFPSSYMIKGPDIFHHRLASKIAMFNLCMKDESVESISFTCAMLDKERYSSCIKKRLHLLDRCTAQTLPEVFSPNMPNCGMIKLSEGLFYVHIRKWLCIVPRERIHFLTLEEVDRNPSLAARGILEFLDLNTALADDASVINKVMQSGHTHSNKQQKVNYNKDTKLQMRKDTKEMLEIFYHPFNSLLAELLEDDKYLWF